MDESTKRPGLGKGESEGKSMTTLCSFRARDCWLLDIKGKFRGIKKRKWLTELGQGGARSNLEEKNSYLGKFFICPGGEWQREKKGPAYIKRGGC